MDSGSSCLVLPAKDASLFYDAVREARSLVSWGRCQSPRGQAQQHDARCSALPKLTLTIGGQVAKSDKSVQVSMILAICGFSARFPDFFV